MLGHDGGVVQADDDLQPPAQVFGLVEQAGLGIAVGVGKGSVHVALAVHHLVPPPVNHRPAGDTHFENIRVMGHQADGHKAAVAPSVHSHACGVHIGK